MLSIAEFFTDLQAAPFTSAVMVPLLTDTGTLAAGRAQELSFLQALRHREKAASSKMLLIVPLHVLQAFFILLIKISC